MISQFVKASRVAILVILVGVPLFTAPCVDQSVENRLVLFGDASEEVPADQATLQVSLSLSDERDMK